MAKMDKIVIMKASIEKLKHKLFKTHYEILSLREDVEFLTGMLNTHFDIKYTLKDFATWKDRNPNADHIPVSENEWYHYASMIQPSNSLEYDPARGSTQLQFRSTALEIKNNHNKS